MSADREAFEVHLRSQGFEPRRNGDSYHGNNGHDWLTWKAALAQVGTGSGAGAQSDSGADSGHFARAVQSEGSTGEAPGWRPIDTAPKDGRWIACIGHLSNDVPDTVRWLVDGWNDGYTREDSQPTHWMPLPPAPAALAKVEAKEKTR